MVEVTNALIYEGLKSVQSRLDRMDNTLGEVKTEIQAVRGHMVAIQQDVGNIYGRVEQMDGRVDRIEKRLGLLDPAH
ncbi:MAG: DUF1664 domain-containing protein [Alphaproteobacteria bacterium]|nr:DUF1664 domain-containing protein [Alphaproteobacteria bacterium]MBU2378429.1 DUF1664 domain-containing protein [Alphaproteobacteria bacterium]